MKESFSTRHIQLLATLGLAFIIHPSSGAAPRCPGNTVSVTPRFVQHALIVIPVKINHAGPFDFMVDTGSQVTVVDPSLSSELNLNSQGRVGIVSVAGYAQTSATLLDSLEADSKVVEKSPAMVQDLRQIQAADRRIRGVLGESFLSHFDLLIDYEHKTLCLDQTSAMRNSVRGERISFVPPPHPDNELPFINEWSSPSISPAPGPSRFCCYLDSGCDDPILYPGSKRAEIQILHP